MPLSAESACRLSEMCIMELSDQYDACTFINLSDKYLDSDGNIITDYYCYDGAHLNGAGYEAWAEMVKEYVE